MKGNAVRALFLLTCFVLLPPLSFAVEVTLLDPTLYTRTKGKPDVNIEPFVGMEGEARLVVINGNEDKKYRVSSAVITINGEEIFGPGDFKKQTERLGKNVTLTTENTLSVELRSKPDTFLTVEIIQDIEPPTVTITADPEVIQPDQSAMLTWSSKNATTVFINPDIGTVDADGSLSVAPTNTSTYTITAEGLAGTATATATITVAPTQPTVTLTASASVIQPGETATLSWKAVNADSAHIDNGIGTVPLSGTVDISPAHTTTYTITVTGMSGSADAQAIVKVQGNPDPPPAGSFGEQYKDLIPHDATVEVYDSRRFSLISGKVLTSDGSPLADVSVTILGFPQYGTASTDGGGLFSIPAEGGSTLTLDYQKPGYLAVQRKVHVPWNDTAVAETVHMIVQDSATTTVTFDGSTDTVTTHQSTPVEDAFGSRSCTMVFSGDNRAYFVDKAGNTVHELTTLSTRATEFTTPETMPAKLPPNSGYTYCVDLSVDGARRVKFGKPVILYVDNFLGFSVGEAVPAGYYDPDRGVWVPAENGVVVKLLDTDGDGIADALDADGDGNPDDLSGNGFSNDEAAGLEDPQRYPPGATFWRVPVTHFTPWDLNWPIGPPADAIAPNPEGVPAADFQKEVASDCRAMISSYVEERSRIFHEEIPIPGTGLTLHYASNRVEGYKRKIDVPASGDTLPLSVKRIVVNLQVAGRLFKQIFDPLPHRKAEFVWDGLDHLGRPVNQSVTAQVSIGYVYDGYYYRPAETGRAFARAGTTITTIRARQEVISWINSPIVVPGKGKGLIAEGWTLSNHHHLDRSDLSTLHKGDGKIVRNNASIITTVAGTGMYGFSGDGGPATEAQTNCAGITIDGSGNLFIADYGNHRVRKVDTNGVITTIAGTGIAGFSNDGGPATEAKLYYPVDVAADAYGNLFIADFYNYRIRKVDPDGIITTVAGNGAIGSGGDGGPATAASLKYPGQVKVDRYGNIYIADRGSRRIRKVDPGGVITNVAGNGIYSAYPTYDLPAVEAMLTSPEFIAVDDAGNLYIKNSYDSVARVDAAGWIRRFAGGNFYGSGDDGIPAIDAKLNGPSGVALDSAGNLYIAEYFNFRIRRVDTSGVIATVAGGGCDGIPCDQNYTGDGGPALQAQVFAPQNIALDPLGNLYIVERSGTRIRKIAPPVAFFEHMAVGDLAFAEENSRGYIISSAGRHKKTIDTDTRKTLEEFIYDANDRLISVVDRFGNQIGIERDIRGAPTAIVSPDGITTTLEIDTSNHLTRITYPDGGQYRFQYTAEGLMNAKIEPEGNRFARQFDESGRLATISDGESGSWTYTRTVHENGDVQVETVSGEGNTVSYLDRTYSTGVYESTITDPTGADIFYSQSLDGLTVSKTLSCGMHLNFAYGVDSEYKLKFLKEIEEITPSGLAKVTLIDRIYQDTDSDGIHDLITETTSVNGKLTAFENNVIQSRKTLTSPAERTIMTEYDPATLLATRQIIPGLYDTGYGYDARGRLTFIHQGTRDTAFNYDDQGFLRSVTDSLDFTTNFTYDAAGRITGVSRPDGSMVSFAYDKNGNMTLLTTPSSVNHAFGYNTVNLASAYSTPVSGSYQYVYDKDRRLIRTVFPSGNWIDYVYDTTRLSQIQTPDTIIDYAYLCGNKVGSITNGSDSITYGYNGKLVTSETLGGNLNQSITYAYDKNFNVTHASYAGKTVSFSYDDDGLLKSAGSFTIDRNPGNGLPESVTDNTVTLTRAFNGYGEVSGEVYAVGSENPVSWNLIRDENGRIVQKAEVIDDVSSPYAYTYDAAGRLLSVTKDGNLIEQYQYDAAGIRISETNHLRNISGRRYSYSVEDHLLIAGDTEYRYNLDGFLVSKTLGADTTAYGYSLRGELFQVTLPDGRIVEYVHDPLGRRIAKKVGGTIVEKYLWQGMTRLLAVFDGSNALLIRFAYADARMPYAMTKGGNVYYLGYDQIGSPRVIFDASDNRVKRIDYDSFGNIINDTAPDFKVPFGFAGGLYDGDTGLVRFGFRDYDPDTGRWTAKDPILFAGGDTDLYGYCLNDPINRRDPYGLLNILFGVGGTAVAPTGLEGSSGIVVNLGLGESEADIGVFGAIGGGAGINVSADAFVGFIKGGIENVSGTTINANAAIGPISFTLMFNIDTGEFMGLTVGLGPSVTPIASSITGSFTGTYTLRDLLKDLRGPAYASNPCK